jgi:hypothetical protein
MAKENHNPAIGRTKTAIVPQTPGERIAIITEIHVQTAPAESKKRLEVRGPVKLDDKALHHVNTVILPIVDQISGPFGLPPKNLIISISNVGVSATIGVGLDISGFSADLPLFLAMLSATLQVGLKQDIISTGHIASLAGDVAPVLDIPSKMEAADASREVMEFVYPDIEKDQSATLLIPEKYIEAKKSIYRHKGRIKLTAIEDILDAMKAFFSEEAIVLASLELGFFNKEPDINDLNSPVNRCVLFLLDNNEKRFWDAVIAFLQQHEAVKAKSIIKSFVDFHLRRKRYPEGFGEKLYRLTMSLPVLARRLNGLFPVVPIEMCIALSQYAQAADHVDVQILYKLTSADEFVKKLDSAGDGQTVAIAEDHEGQLLRKILFEMSDLNLTQKIGKPLDEARANYPTKPITVKDASEFNEAITGFYTHMMRYTQSPKGHASWDAAAAEAIDIIKEAFRVRGGYEAALAEGKSGIKGGLRFIFDIMTDHEKSVKNAKYGNMVLKEAIDPLNWDAKVKLSGYILHHYGRYLPDAFRTTEPGQIAHHLEEVILLLVGRETNMDRWFRKH